MNSTISIRPLLVNKIKFKLTDNIIAESINFIRYDPIRLR